MLATAQLASGLDIFRISLHVFFAAVWIGGQVVVAGLIPTVRGFGPDAPGKVARAFAKMSWPAFYLLIATGIWNDVAAGANATHTWNVVFGLKILVVAGAGVAVYLHTKVRSAAMKGVMAALGLVFSLIAMVLGVALAG